MSDEILIVDDIRFQESLIVDNYLYPKKIIAALGEFGLCEEETSLIEQYLWTTYGGESIDF